MSTLASRNAQHASVYTVAKPATVVQKAPFALLDTKLLLRIFLILRDEFGTDGHSLCINSGPKGGKAHLCHKDRRSLLGVFLVCGRFYAIGMNSKELWTGVTLNLEDSRDGRLPRAVDALRPFFDRAGSNNRSLSFQNFNFYDQRQPLHDDTKDTITDTHMTYLNKVLTHVDELYLDSSVVTIASLLHRDCMVAKPDGKRSYDFEGLARSPKWQVLQLLSLTMRLCKREPLVTKLYIAAEMQKLHLDYHGGPAEVKLLHPHSLTELRLTFESHDLKWLGGPLSQASATLAVLEINITRFNEARTSPLRNPLENIFLDLIEFPQLRALTINSECHFGTRTYQKKVLEMVLLSLWAPSLTDLTIFVAPRSIELSHRTILAVVMRNLTAQQKNHTLRNLTLQNVDTDRAGLLHCLHGLKEGKYSVEA